MHWRDNLSPDFYFQIILFLYTGIQPAYMGLLFDLLNIPWDAIVTLLFGSLKW